eukprot:gb/GECH01004352.1/.p1 GENE.gb/GECH01004352.1/~~gb/GECH01004352.1/.p1  ORF type:complete len:170 (+),score=49.95 gb/GECH01004352.1/:1-510(+)
MLRSIRKTPLKRSISLNNNFHKNNHNNNYIFNSFSILNYNSQSFFSSSSFKQQQKQKRQFHQKNNRNQQKDWIWGRQTSRAYSQEVDNENEEYRERAKKVLNASEIKKRNLVRTGPYTTQKSTNFATGLFLVLLALIISMGVIVITVIQNDKQRKKKREKEEKLMKEFS